MTRVRTSLNRHLPRTMADRDQLDAMAKAAWHKQGVATIRVDELRSEMDRRYITTIAEELWDKRW